MAGPLSSTRVRLRTVLVMPGSIPSCVSCSNGKILERATSSNCAISRKVRRTPGCLKCLPTTTSLTCSRCNNGGAHSIRQCAWTACLRGRQSASFRFCREFLPGTLLPWKAPLYTFYQRPGEPMSLSAVIVDDEQLARDELAFLLKNVGDIEVVAQGKNGVEGVNLIREHNPDMVFLDVQMPGLDGFGVLKKLLDKKVPLPQIVFATAYDQYAVKAFEVNAVDYLLKPFDKKRVAQSVQRVRSKLESSAAT